MKRILIVVPASDAAFGAGDPGYLVEFLMQEWRGSGLDIAIVRGTGDAVPADVLIPHIDLTRTPDTYREFMARYPVVVNGTLLDTSKSRVSANLVGRLDAWDGPVIVKTDNNYGGLPEARLHDSSGGHLLRPWARSRTLAGKLAAKVTGSVPWRLRTHLNTSDYPIFRSLGDVPHGVFANPALVVEKFMPEREGDDYLLRYCYCFGDREMSFLLRSHEPIVKFSNAFKVEEVATPPGVRKFRQRFGFTFGKLDYFIHDGEAEVFDANKTPGHTAGHAGGRHEALYQQMVEHLAAGIWPILDGTFTLGCTQPDTATRS